MRVIRLAGKPIVVRIKRRGGGEVTVIVSADAQPPQTLSLARVVLSPAEWQELHHALSDPL